jgi:signal peptidase II
VETYPLINNVFHLTYVENRGAAFGILQNRQWFFILITFIVLAVVIFYIYNKKDKLNNFLLIALAMIVGGAIGNLIDRMIRGFVVDFFDFTLINFAVFNIADCFVVVGTILLAIYIIFESKKEIVNE